MPSHNRSVGDPLTFSSTPAQQFYTTFDIHLLVGDSLAPSGTLFFISLSLQSISITVLTTPAGYFLCQRWLAGLPGKAKNNTARVYLALFGPAGPFFDVLGDRTDSKEGENLRNSGHSIPIQLVKAG